MSDELPEHVARNRAAWDGYAPGYTEAGHRAWAADEPAWGVFGVPEARLGVLPAELEGKDTIELGCGTGYVSAWLARRGARPVGIDNSPAQLESARRFQEEFALEFPLHLGNAEQTPFADKSFDVAISEYGASIWCDPYLLDPRGGPDPAPRRRADLPRQRHHPDAVRPETRTRYRPASGCCGPTSECTGSSGRTSRPSSSISATAT